MARHPERDTPDPQQLALFDAGFAAARPVAAPPSPSPLPPSLPPPGAGRALPVAAPADGDASARFLHPRASRSIVLGEHRVGYALRRAQRRSIGLTINVDGLAVAAPRWVSLGDVEQALRAKSAWILRKLHEQHERQRRVEAARIDWRDGAVLPYLGEPLCVRLDPAAGAARLEDTPDGRVLRIGLPQTAEPAQIREVVQAWLQRQARDWFRVRVAHFAPRLGVTVRRLGLSSAATRWGSASADGSVRLHWRLMHFAPAVIDYVVTHELAHLREMNHSPAFWEVVRSVLPDYELTRGALRSDVLPRLD
ncbi:M48 family metallopeptidase [Pseudaquabacterium rugosum]|uniref:SprT family zinc-dependent metalloprotease n=1 Tax=Pseudaquabacterium rugosum TaxID=2984194 RepID=A0ABU9B5W3_9BURK